MSTGYKTRMEKVFDRLTNKQFEIGDDPELAALHTEASRHFYAAVDYKRAEKIEFNTDYELDQVIEALDRFDEVNEYDKGL